ncbi:MAG: permease-like cell division protein FtsX [Clostridia bacterium]
MFRLIGRSVVEGFKSIWAHGLMSLASVGTVAVSLLVLAVFLVVAANLSYLADVLEDQVEIVAYCQPDFDRRWEKTLLDKAESVPGVGEVTFVDGDAALDRLKDQFGSQADLLSAVEEDNPLRDSLEITVDDPDRIEQVAEQIAAIDSVQGVAYQQETIQRLYALTKGLRTAGVGLVFLLAAATFLLISNTIRLTIYARREEIEIMRLVGASAAFIWAPFVVEGLLLGLIGAAVAGGVVFLGYVDLIKSIHMSLPFLPLLGSQPLLGNLIQLLAITGGLLGLLSSWFSALRYVRI